MSYRIPDHLTKRADRDRYQQLMRLKKRVDDELTAMATPPRLEPVKITRRSRHIEPECGTESGYQRHRYRAAKFDEPWPEACGCPEAHAVHNRDKARERKAAREHLLADLAA